MKTLTKTEWTAGEGSVGQSGAKTVYECECGGRVVWTQSKRTSKYYLVDVMTGATGSLYYVGAAIHKCEERLARRAEAEVFDQWLADRDLNSFLWAVKVIREGLAEGSEFTLPDWWSSEYAFDATQEGSL